MYLSRKLDDKQLILLKQGKGFFHIGASGHEAAQIAASKFINCKIDYSYPYYRNQAYCIGLGMSSKEILPPPPKNPISPPKAGQEAFISITKSYFHSAAGAIVVYDITKY